jgi:hypothetical protein
MQQANLFENHGRFIVDKKTPEERQVHIDADEHVTYVWLKKTTFAGKPKYVVGIRREFRMAQEEAVGQEYWDDAASIAGKMRALRTFVGFKGCAREIDWATHETRN